MAAAEALGGPRSYQGSQHSLRRGLACVPGHTLSCTHKHRYTYSQRALRDPRLLTHVSRTHPGTCLCCLFAEAHLQTYQGGYLLREVHKPMQDTPPPVSSHPQLSNRHNRDSHHLGDCWLRNTPLHTPRHTWPCPRDGQSLETPSDISEAHTHMRGHTQTHTESLHTGARIRGNPRIRPCPAGTDTAHHPATPAASSTERASSRGPCTPRLTDTHPRDTHEQDM